MKIRNLEKRDETAVLNIWLNTSLLAHDFVAAEYWHSKIKDMKDVYLPNSQTFVYEENNEVIGFISMVDNYIAAIFIEQQQRSKGIGKQLISFIKEHFPILELGVFAKNSGAIAFYKKQGFTIIEEKTDQDTGEQELVMQFKNHFV
ncbi:N-acetyltransferase [Pseudopedobacter beijingensis]|uniref:N-acetyltransferase n=1 Tax=Pseudopedobacter beijingensis TaxID=1207056 RepID=A0ABW4ICF0_9SPHI